MVAIQHDTLVHDLQAKISELTRQHDGRVHNLQAHMWELTEHMCAMQMQMTQLYYENLCLKSLMADHKSSDVSTEFGDQEPLVQSSLSDSSESEPEVVEVIDSDTEACRVQRVCFNSNISLNKLWQTSRFLVLPR